MERRSEIGVEFSILNYQFSIPFRRDACGSGGNHRAQPGQVITVRKQAKDSPVFVSIRESHEKYSAPKWLKADSNALSAEVIAVPDAADAEQGLDMRLVVEFYSRN